MLVPLVCGAISIALALVIVWQVRTGRRELNEAGLALGVFAAGGVGLLVLAVVRGLS